MSTEIVPSADHAAVKAVFSAVRSGNTIAQFMRDNDDATIAQFGRYILLNKGKLDTFPKGQDEQKWACYQAFKVWRQAFKASREGLTLKTDRESLTVYADTTTSHGGNKTGEGSSSSKASADLNKSVEQVNNLLENRGHQATQVIASMCVSLGIEADDLREDIERIKNEYAEQAVQAEG